jgi:hypothetical protein
MDIHKYDCKLSKPSNFYDDFNYDKKELMTELIQHFSTFSKQNDIKIYGLRGLEIIKNDINSKANYVTTDNIYAEDILIGIFILLKKYITDKEIIETTYHQISEQMKHMFETNGLCPIGRSRSIQIYQYLKDHINQKHFQ